MGKNFARTDYALNHLDKKAIVCPSVDGVDHRLTKEQFESEAEFLFWKSFSDGDYRETELRERPYTDDLLFLSDLSDDAAKAPSAEDALLSMLTTLDILTSHTQLRNALTLLTPIEKRRLLLNTINGLTVRQIGLMDRCSHKQVVKSIGSAKKKLKIFLKNGVPKP